MTTDRNAGAQLDQSEQCRVLEWRVVQMQLVTPATTTDSSYYMYATRCSHYIGKLHKDLYGCCSMSQTSK